MTARRLALIGLGPHARTVHYPLLERATDPAVELMTLIELEDQRETVEAYLAGAGLRPKEIVYLPASCRDGEALHPRAREALDRARLDGLWGVVVATEPRSHLIYTEWALTHGLDVLLDKPVTARQLNGRPPEAALALVDDYQLLAEAARRSGARCLVQTHRRLHQGYAMVRDLVAEVVAATGVPLTYLDIYHCDGMWNMPDEFWSRENHPYKYGYGKLMHSGYHLVDLLAWLLPAAGRFEFDVRHQGPADFLDQVGEDFYRRTFGSAASRISAAFAARNQPALADFGETDVHLLGQVVDRGRVRTTVSMNLLQTGFSRRAWADLPADTYRSNGRIRHERLTIQVAHLLTVQVHSYQVAGRPGPGEVQGDVGHPHHFEVAVFRNTGVIGGRALERHQFSTSGASLHQLAREGLVDAYLAGTEEVCSLTSNELTVKLVAAISYAVRSRIRGADCSPAIQLQAGPTNWLELGGAFLR